MKENKVLQLALNNYNKFAQLEGSDHIATISSQINLIELLVKFPPKVVLDWGSGIGTLSKLVLEASNSKVVSFERNQWCRDQYLLNLGEDPRLELVSVEPIKYTFDTIIIDDDILRRQIKHLLENKLLSVIFIEGWRNRTVAHVSIQILLNGRSAKFYRCDSRLKEYNLLSKHGSKIEKSGSYFLIENNKTRINSVYSWVLRVGRTKEFGEVYKEFYFWIGKTLNPTRRISVILNFIKK
jgi:hypothetical protein